MAAPTVPRQAERAAERVGDDDAHVGARRGLQRDAHAGRGGVGILGEDQRPRTAACGGVRGERVARVDAGVGGDEAEAVADHYDADGAARDGERESRKISSTRRGSLRVSRASSRASLWKELDVT